jgi:hypothetical protein
MEGMTTPNIDLILDLLEDRVTEAEQTILRHAPSGRALYLQAVGRRDGLRDAIDLIKENS